MSKLSQALRGWFSGFLPGTERSQAWPVVFSTENFCCSHASPMSFCFLRGGNHMRKYHHKTIHNNCVPLQLFAELTWKLDFLGSPLYWMIQIWNTFCYRWTPCVVISVDGIQFLWRSQFSACISPFSCAVLNQTFIGSTRMGFTMYLLSSSPLTICLSIHLSKIIPSQAKCMTFWSFCRK